jgi:hypothetical protein
MDWPFLFLSEAKNVEHPYEFMKKKHFQIKNISLRVIPSFSHSYPYRECGKTAASLHERKEMVSSSKNCSKYFSWM